ncbi:hypothetical protein D3C71_644390 [compost metagenome]
MQKWTVIRENAGERPQKGRRNVGGNVDEGTGECRTVVDTLGAEVMEKVEIAAGIVSPELHVPGRIIWEILPDPDLYSLEYYLRLKRGINRYKSLLIRINISINTLLHNQRVCRCAEAGRNNNKQKGNFTQITYKSTIGYKQRTYIINIRCLKKKKLN